MMTRFGEEAMNRIANYPVPTKEDWDRMFRNKEKCERALGYKLKIGKDPFDDCIRKQGFSDYFEYLYECI